MSSIHQSRLKGFTMIEMLIVLGIIIITASIAVVIINPIQRFREANDAQRISEINTLAKAVEIAQSELKPIGTSLKVYVSRPDPCSEDELMGLAIGWSYECVSSNSFTRANGTGWLPVDVRSSLKTLAIDSEASANPERVYMYITNGADYLFTTKLTSEKYRALAVSDGGPDDTRYEIGSNLNLWNQAVGLIATWHFNEGSGTALIDVSGQNKNGVLEGGPTWVDGILGSALAFDGVDDKVTFGSSHDLQPANITVAAWVKRPETSGSWADEQATLFFWAKEGHWTSNGWYLELFHTECLNLVVDGANYFTALYSEGQQYWWQCDPNIFYPANEWVHIAATFDDASNIGALYRNGVPLDVNISGSPDTITTTDTDKSIGGFYGFDALVDGHMDDLRIYNRALSASDIRKIYDDAR